MVENGRKNPPENPNGERASSPASHHPVKYCGIMPSPNTLGTPDSSTLMERVLAPLPVHVPSPGPNQEGPQHHNPLPTTLRYPENQSQHGFALSSPPLWSSGVPPCFHLDMTPMFGKSDFFRCDECWRKPEAGWLYTCTQAVVKSDGLIDPRHKSLLDPRVYTAVKDGGYTKDEVKILVKQRLSVLNMSHERIPPFYPPLGSGPGYGTLYQGQRAKDKERQRYLPRNGVRVRLSEEISHRSPSPRAYHDHDEEEVLETRENASGEQQHVVADEVDDFGQYILWVNTVVNTRNRQTFSHNGAQVEVPETAPYIPSSADYEHDDDEAWVQTVEDIGVEQQQNLHHRTIQVRPEESQPRSPGRSYFERIRREMYSYDYHMAVSEMHRSSQYGQQFDISRLNQGPQKTDHRNLVVAPVSVRPADQNFDEENHLACHKSQVVVPPRPAYVGVNREQPIPCYYDPQVQAEMARGRSLQRQINNTDRHQQTHRPSFVLNVHPPGKDQPLVYHRVPDLDPARPVDRDQWTEHHNAPAATSVYPSYTGPRPLPLPPRSCPPRPLYPCDYKICAACRGELEGLVSRLNAGTTTEDGMRAMKPGHEEMHTFSPHEQQIFFSPDFASPGRDQDVLLRDAQYFLNSDETGFHHFTTSHSAIVNLGVGNNDNVPSGSGAVDRSPAVHGETLVSRMERLAVDSSSGESVDVDSGEQKVLASHEREM